MLDFFSWSERKGAILMSTGVTAMLRKRLGHLHRNEGLLRDHLHFHDEHHRYTDDIVVAELY
jgi:hypothetical protein